MPFTTNYGRTTLKPHHVPVTGKVSAKNSTKGGIFHIASVNKNFLYSAKPVITFYTGAIDGKHIVVQLPAHN